MLVDMRRQFGIRPGLSGIAEILRFLTGEIYDPGLFIVRDFGITAAAGRG